MRAPLSPRERSTMTALWSMLLPLSLEACSHSIATQSLHIEYENSRKHTWIQDFTPSESEIMSEFSVESLLGAKLLTKVGSPQKSTTELMKDKDLLLLYFSASWCPPCKVFSPILVNFYNACAKEGKLEIVYVSSDRTIPDFEAYYQKMPWLAILPVQESAAIKKNLAQQLGIQGIPTLVVLDAKTGEFISAQGREDVTTVSGDTLAGKELISKWKNMERRPFSEAPTPVDGAQNPIMTVLIWFANNPVAWFAIMYIVMYIYRKRLHPAGPVDEGEEMAEPPQMEEDSEF